jgi:hypothetical protein
MRVEWPASAKDDDPNRSVAGRRDQQRSIVMQTNGDDGGRYRFRQETEEERATYRRWLRGIIFFYCGLMFIAGVAVATYSDRSRPDQTSLLVQRTVEAARAR